jgi:membrane associated rhomboid family serine protease
MNPQNNINSINNQNQSNCQEDMKNLYYSMPFFIRFVVTSTIILYLLNLFIPQISFILSNIPYLIIFKFQIWRFFTNAFITTSIFNIIFALISWVKDASNLESNIGTMKYMMIFMVNSIFIQIIEMTILFIIYLICGRQESILYMNVINGYVNNDGLWPIIMAELTLLCLCNPEIEMRFMFFPCVIKAKYYPIVLVGFFTVLNQFHINFGVLAGIIYGFIYHKYLKNVLVVSDNFIFKIEKCFMFKWMTKCKGYMKCGNNNNTVQTISFSNETNGNNNVGSNNDNTGNKGFVAFSGKGVTVGSSDNNSTNTSINSSGYQNVTQDSS